MSDIAGYRPEIEVNPALVRADEIMTLSGDPSLLGRLVGPLEPIDIRQTLQDMYNAVA
jgi:hypothetical protein